MNDLLDFPFDAGSGLRRWSGVRMLTGKLTLSSAASRPSISATAWAAACAELSAPASAHRPRNTGGGLSPAKEKCDDSIRIHSGRYPERSRGHGGLPDEHVGAAVLSSWTADGLADRKALSRISRCGYVSPVRSGRTPLPPGSSRLDPEHRVTAPGTECLAHERIHPGLPAHLRNHGRALLAEDFGRCERLGMPASAQPNHTGRPRRRKPSCSA